MHVSPMSGAAAHPRPRQLRQLRLQPRAVPRRAGRRADRPPQRHPHRRGGRGATARGVLLSPGPGRPGGRRRSSATRCPPSPPAARPCSACASASQAIGHVYGATIVGAATLMHGKTSPIDHDGRTIFAGLPSPLTATRYHSLTIDPATVPACLEVTATTADGTVMGVRHREHARRGHASSTPRASSRPAATTSCATGWRSLRPSCRRPRAVPLSRTRVAARRALHCRTVAPPKRKTGGRVTPVGHQARRRDPPPRARPVAPGSAASSRYTPPVPQSAKESPPWLPALMLGLFVVGARGHHGPLPDLPGQQLAADPRSRVPARRLVPGDQVAMTAGEVIHTVR